MKIIEIIGISTLVLGFFISYSNFSFWMGFIISSIGGIMCLFPEIKLKKRKQKISEGEVGK